MVVMCFFFAALFLFGQKKENTIVCSVFANNQLGNHALIVQMKA